MLAVFRAIETADPEHYVRGQYDGYRGDRGRRGRLDDRDVRGAAPRDRQLALVGRAVLHPHREADAGRRRPRCGSSSSGRRRLGFKRDRRAAWSRTSSWSSSTRRPACGSCSTPTAPTSTRPEPVTLRHRVRRRGRRGRDALRGAAARGDDRRQHALHAPGRRRGDVADHAAAARLAAAGAPVRARHDGPGRGRRARRGPRPLARAVGARPGGGAERWSATT